MKNNKNTKIINNRNNRNLIKINKKQIKIYLKQ